MISKNKNSNRGQRQKVSFLCIPHEWQNPGKLEKISMNYPLEVTNELYQRSMYPLSTILNNIAKGLKDMSIQAKFISDPLSAALRTKENIEMHLSFWLSNDEKHIIVEIQRIRGCSVKFHNYTRHLFEAIQGKFDNVGFRRHHDSDAITRLKMTEMLLYEYQRNRDIAGDNLMTNDDDETESTESIEIAQDLVQKDRIDSRILGWEALCFLTSMESTRTAACSLASRALLIGEAPFQGIHSSLFNILLKHNMGDDEFCKLTEDDNYYYYDSDSDSDEEDFFIDSSDDSTIQCYPHYLAKTVDAIFNLALTAFSNALEVLSGTDTAHSFTKNKHFSDILSVLMDGIANASKNPHNAVLSIKCLTHLCQNAPTRVMMFEELEQNSNIIEEAYLLGYHTHALLQDTSQILLDMIDSNRHIHKRSSLGTSFVEKQSAFRRARRSLSLGCERHPHITLHHQNSHSLVRAQSTS